MNNQIYVYKGEGVNEICFDETMKHLQKFGGRAYQYLQVDASFIKREEAPSLFVFPGGKAVEMGWKARESAKKVNEAVNKGSSFLGFCAGAIVSSSFWNYQLPTMKLSSDDLGEVIFDLGHLAEGPVFLDPFDANSYNYESLVSIHFKPTNKIFKTYWKQGPLFKDRLGQETIAEYVHSSNPNIPSSSLPAVIHTKKGQGPVVCIGNHPELAEWCHKTKFLLSAEDIRANEELLRYSFKLVGVKEPSPE